MPRAKKVTQDLADKNLPGVVGFSAEQDELKAAGSAVAEVTVPQPATTPVSSSAPPLDPFNRPTERPNEPVTSGLSGGPGAGPAVVSAEDIQKLREASYALEARVSQPGATNAQRAKYHEIRAILLRAGRAL